MLGEVEALAETSREQEAQRVHAAWAQDEALAAATQRTEDEVGEFRAVYNELTQDTPELAFSGLLRFLGKVMRMDTIPPASPPARGGSPEHPPSWPTSRHARGAGGAL